MSKEKRIDLIISASVDEFKEKGFDGTSMDAIARRAGISKGGLYHHFNSKDEIFLMANHKIYEPITKMRSEAEQIQSPSDAMLWYIKTYLEYWQDHKSEVIFSALSMAKMLEIPALEDMYENYTEKYISFFKGLYQRGIQQGEFVLHDSYQSALILMTALDGIVMYLVMDHNLRLDTVCSIFQKQFVQAYQLKKNDD